MYVYKRLCWRGTERGRGKRTSPTHFISETLWALTCATITPRLRLLIRVRSREPSQRGGSLTVGAKYGNFFEGARKFLQVAWKSPYFSFCGVDFIFVKIQIFFPCVAGDFGIHPKRKWEQVIRFGSWGFISSESEKRALFQIYIYIYKTAWLNITIITVSLTILHGCM